MVFTGDLYDNYAKYHDDNNITAALQKIEAKYEKIIKAGGFTLLKNSNWYITVENGVKILFTGLDDSILGNPHMPGFQRKHDADFEILLTHEPDAAENYPDYDFVLSGHSHGGQINIPFLPALNKKAVASTALSTKYSGGMYILDENSNRKLYVNTGIGTTHISARFNVVPEIAVFYVYL